MFTLYLFGNHGKRLSGKAVEIIASFIPHYIDNLALRINFPVILCLIQIELLLHHDFLKEALQVAVAGIELFRDSVMIWELKLRVLIESKSPDVARHFEEAFASLKPQVCELGLLYFILLGKPSKTQAKVYLECTCLMRAGPRVHLC